MQKIMMLICLLSFLSNIISAQSVEIPITVTDGSGGSQVIKFGLDAEATDRIDTSLGEASLPPLPPTGIFDARFNLPNSTESSLKDYRQGGALFNGQKVHEIQYQIGTGTIVTISWNLPTGVAGRLQDVITGTLIDVQMTGSGSYQVANPGAFNKLKLTATYTLGPTPPEVPVLSSPANGATGQPVNLTLSWNAVATAASYRLQVATDSLFGNIVFNDSTIISTSKQISGLQNSTDYYWRVNAKNAVGISGYSTVWNFLTFSLISQATIDIPITVTDGLGGTQVIRFGLDSTATDGIDISLGEASLPPLPPIGIFDARLNLSNSTESSLKDYRQGGALFNGQKLHEIQYQVGLGLNITISWNLPNGVVGRLQDVITGTLIDVLMTGIGSYQVTNPGAFNKLKLTATYLLGPTPPEVPELLTPVNNSLNQPIDVTLSWNAAATATSYRLQVATDSLFGNIVFNDSTIISTSKQISGLQNSTKYFWRVNAKNETGSGEFSTIWNFTTIVAHPGVPELLTPANNSLNQPVNVTLSWNAISIASSYGLQVATDSLFGNILFNDSTVSSTSKQISGLQNNTKYFWRVNAKNVAGTSGYSTVWNFKTIVAIPGVVTLISPENSAMDFSIRPVFKWRKDSSAQIYRFELSRDINFLNLVLIDSTITDTIKSLGSDLLYKSKYYWRVKANNYAGTGTYSTIFNFTTQKQPVAVPSNLQATWLLNGTVRLHWSDNSTNEAGFIIKRKLGDSLSANQFIILDTAAAGSIEAYDSTALQTTLYTYLITAYTIDSMYSSSNMAVLQTGTGVKDGLKDRPTEYGLFQNYPNPFNPSTRIKYSLPEESRVKITVYNSLGEMVKILANEAAQSGWFETNFNASAIPSGSYFAKIEAQSLQSDKQFIQTIKMLLIK